MDTVVRDIRFAVRAATRRPGAYALALVTCALGIGTTTGMFSVVDTVLWRPLPYPDADQLVSVYLTRPKQRNDPAFATSWQRGLWSYPEYVGWRDRQSVFERAAIYVENVSTMTGGRQPERIPTGMASPDLFPMLGASPVLGRGFSASDAWETERRTVLLSNGFWQSRYGGDRGVIGREMQLDGEAYTIIGVLPERFSLPNVAADIWVMVGGPAEEESPEGHGYDMIARLKPGVGLRRAGEETGALVRGLWATHSDQHDALAVPLQAEETREVRTPLQILLAASLLLLALSCVTVAALVLGIGIDREHELAVRDAIGAGRGRVARQLLTESLVLASAGGVAGVAIAFVVTKALVLLAPPGIPRLGDVSVNGRVLGFAIITSMIVGTAFGLVPALSLTRGELIDRMRRQRATASKRLHAALVVGQIALACVLLMGAGLLARTLLKLDRVNPGFDANGVLTVRVSVPWRRLLHIEAFDGVRYDQIYERLREAIAATPGVQAVAVTKILPYAGDHYMNVIEPEGYALQPDERITGERNYVSPNYLDLMHMRLLEGRSFTEADNRPDAPKVTIVTERLARRFWPGASAIGHTITFFGRTLTIVGVIADVRDHTLTSTEGYYRYYIPRGQEPGQGGSFVVRVRPGTDPASLIPILRRSMASAEPEVPITSAITLRQRMNDSIAEQRYRARLIWVFATLAALFAILGVYGVTSRSVAARSREIGIRMVLGQRPAGIVRWVLRQGILLALGGSAIGLVAGIAASRLLANFLFETETTDPVTLVSVALGLALLSAVASAGPSHRAASVDPMTVIRSD